MAKIASKPQVNPKCIETALLWFGISANKDDLALPKPDFLEEYGMQKINQPEFGCAVVITYETYSGIGRRVAHMGIVVNSSPRFVLTHRIGSGTPIRLDDLRNFLNNNYQGYKAEYYRPSLISRTRCSVLYPN